MRMVGVDRSPRMLAVAKRRLAREGVSAALVQGDGRMLAFERGTFDCVMATFPTSHIFEVNTLREIHRVLRKNGRLTILGVWVTVDLAGLEQYVPLFYGKPNVDALAKLAQRVEGAGFAVRWSNQRMGLFTVGTMVAEHAGALMQEQQHDVSGR
jgi:ubiquinone/menaquinone biosynthesis C-methylase UbiE